MGPYKGLGDIIYLCKSAMAQTERYLCSVRNDSDGSVVSPSIDSNQLSAMENLN